MKNIKNAKIENNKVIYTYCTYIREGLRKKEASVKKFEHAINLWNKFTKGKDFRKCTNQKYYLEFKDEIRSNTRSLFNEFSQGHRWQILNNLQGFFKWLSQRPGYKNSTKMSDLVYLSPSKEESDYRNYHEVKNYPTLQQVIKLCDSIKINNDIDLRDRALIAFLFISAIRVDAVASLLICSYKQKSGFIDQNPRHGVRVKFSKQIKTYLFPLSSKLKLYFDEYYNQLINKGFGNDKPLFPKSEIKMDGLSFCKRDTLSQDFMSSSTIREIIKDRCDEAQMERFNPHSFRHGCIALAFENAKDAQEIKAISQNVGHASIQHVMTTYGQLPDKTLELCIKNIGDSHEVK